MKILIACKVLEREIGSIVKDRSDIYTIFFKFAYHSQPVYLNRLLLKTIDKLKHSNEIILLYGRCAGITPKSFQNINVLDIHDCFDLLIGQNRRYSIFMEEPGTYFLSEGWVLEDGTPYEKLLSYKRGYKLKELSNIIYSGYKRIAFIRTGIESTEYIKRVEFSAKKLGWDLLEINSELEMLKEVLKP